jgi:hypothetical protein
MKLPTALFLLALASAVTTGAAEKVAPVTETISPPIGQLTTPGWRYEELRRFKAPEAGQGGGGGSRVFLRDQ